MTNQKVFFYNTLNWTKIYAVFLNSKNKIKIELKQTTGLFYTCNVDSEKFDFVFFLNEYGVHTMYVAFNKYCFIFRPSGYTYNGVICLEPFIANTNISVQTTNITFSFRQEQNKIIYIWTPSDYNQNFNSKKYGVLYMFDGQNLFNNNSTIYGSWHIPQVMELIGNYIVVGIDNGDRYRDLQLTPNIGKIKNCYAEMFSSGVGIEFAEFLVNVIVPYINSHYNVFTDKSHTAICGSSSGGLESFYAGVVYNKIFGTLGSFSPAFSLYENYVWKNFLNNIDVKNIPKIYLYSGYGDIFEREIYPYADITYKQLTKNGCKNNNLKFDFIEDNPHNEACWSGIFIKFAGMLNQLI
ncbi:MAG: alpha/beta hydrolase-fold protein [Acutalibacteraceae bacterium]|nr:alpha/beta hydrolase-fold protein [Acutalibacteraceae bacterium]